MVVIMVFKKINTLRKNTNRNNRGCMIDIYNSDSMDGRIHDGKDNTFVRDKVYSNSKILG